MYSDYSFLGGDGVGGCCACGPWDLSSLSRDQTPAPCIGRTESYWTTEGVPIQVILKPYFSWSREKCSFDHLFLHSRLIQYTKMDLASLQYPIRTHK